HGVLPDVPTRVGNAESVPLPTASVDAVVLGQAWHWVEPVSGSKECARVIRPGGVLGLIWNIRDESVDWVNRLGDIMRGSAAERMLATGDPPLHEPFGDMESARWKWVRPMNRDGLMDMARSRSYVITASRAERARIEAGLSTLLDELGLEGGASIKFPYTTRAYRAIRPCDDPL
ncbi:MAG TPA: class I SAM-dependent methyltransferase, partial [Acidimicrobiia bacterium]|nr:class I SAM-dependent methyltransferase [Acidimicrobiia bacterium]